MNKNKRIVALVVCIALMAVMLFSSAYVAHLADHDCIGEGCQICAVLENCQQNLKNLLAVAVVAVFVAAAAHFFWGSNPYFKKIFTQNTLIQLKVKLSNSIEIDYTRSKSVHMARLYWCCHTPCIFAPIFRFLFTLEVIFYA